MMSEWKHVIYGKSPKHIIDIVEEAGFTTTLSSGNWYRWVDDPGGQSSVGVISGSSFGTHQRDVWEKVLAANRRIHEKMVDALIDTPEESATPDGPMPVVEPSSKGPPARHSSPTLVSVLVLAAFLWALLVAAAAM